MTEKRRPGQPRVKPGEETVRVDVSLPESLAKRAKKYGDTRGITKMSAIVRSIVESFFR